MNSRDEIFGRFKRADRIVNPLRHLQSLSLDAALLIDHKQRRETRLLMKQVEAQLRASA